MSGPSRALDQSPSRLHSLDGLRGAAALVVLGHHGLLLVPGFAAACWPAGTSPGSPTTRVG